MLATVPEAAVNYVASPDRISQGMALIGGFAGLLKGHLVLLQVTIELGKLLFQSLESGLRL